ncbi:MAG: acyl-CoA thioesterase [Bacteroidota bacterium]
MTSSTFKSPAQSRVIISELMLPSHSNFSGKIHGGYILSLMDQIAFACASKHSGTYCVTASVDTVDFLNPIEIGELVTMRASVNYVGRTSMVVGIRVEAEHIQTGQIKHCNSSYFTMVAKNEEGKSVMVPGLWLENETDIRRFLKSLRRTEQKRQQRTQFKEEVFEAEDHLSLLKGQRVLLREEY